MEDADVRWRLRQNPWTGPADLRQCRSNLRNVSTALEMYSTDASGRFPPTLASLEPDYLRTIPTCPARGADTYSAGYDRSADTYTLFCRGLNHAAVGPDQPFLPRVMGLVEK